MNSLIRRLLFGDDHIKEYVAVTLNNEIMERVYLEVDGNKIDISGNQWLLSLYPAVWGIWLPNGQIDIKDYNCARYKITVCGNSEKPVANLTLLFFDKITENDGSLLLFKIGKSTLLHLSLFKIKLLFHKFYKKDNFTFDALKAFAAAYSYPRKVSLVSYKENDYYNIFPMDLLGEIPNTGRFVFGLRHTNIVLSKIIETRRLVVSDIGSEFKDIVYQLGKHHGTTPPPVNLLPFKINTTQKFEFYIPEWVNGYVEIKILKTLDIGSHMLLWGEIQNRQKLKPGSGRLYHIHYLMHLYQKHHKQAYPLA